MMSFPRKFLATFWALCALVLLKIAATAASLGHKAAQKLNRLVF